MYQIGTVTKKFCSRDYLTGAAQEPGRRQAQVPAIRLYLPSLPVYHFIFVPLTVGLSILVACMQTAWLMKKDPLYLRMTKFFGTLFLMNFAVGAFLLESTFIGLWIFGWNKLPKAIHVACLWIAVAGSIVSTGRLP